MSVDLALVGATGAVGRTALEILANRDFPIGRLRLIASARSAGQKISTAWGKVEVEDLDEVEPDGIELAIFSAGASRSRIHAPRFVAGGAVVVDNSSCFRMDPSVPLVVADVNDHALGVAPGNRGQSQLHDHGVDDGGRSPSPGKQAFARWWPPRINRFRARDREGWTELSEQIHHFLENPSGLTQGGWADPHGDVYSRPIGFNVLPLAGTETQRSYTDEEWEAGKRVPKNPRTGRVGR